MKHLSRSPYYKIGRLFEARTFLFRIYDLLFSCSYSKVSHACSESWSLKINGNEIQWDLLQCICCHLTVYVNDSSSLGLYKWIVCYFLRTIQCWVFQFSARALHHSQSPSVSVPRRSPFCSIGSGEDAVPWRSQHSDGFSQKLSSESLQTVYSFPLVKQCGIKAWECTVRVWVSVSLAPSVPILSQRPCIVLIIHVLALDL